MKTTELIAQHILDVHEGGNWTEVDIVSALTDVSWQEAIAVTAASTNTIAALLYHLTFYNNVVARRIKGIGTDIPESNGFDLPTITSAADWAQLKQDNITSSHELAEAIRSVDEARLEEPIMAGYSSFYKNMQGCVEHVHYHLGQIVLLKNLIRNSQ